MGSKLAPALILGFWLLGPHSAAVADDWSITRERKPGTRRALPTRTSRPRGRSGRPALAAERVGPDGRRTLASAQEARFLRMLRKDPSQAAIVDRLLALGRVREGGLSELLVRVQRLQEAEPDRLAWLLLGGHVERARERPEAARAHFQRAVVLSPDSPLPFAALAELEADAGDHGARAAWLRKALAATPRRNRVQRSEALRALAEAALDAGDFAVAAEHFDTLRRLHEGSVFATTEFARALASRGHHRRAVGAYERAIERLRGDRRVLPSLLLGKARAQLDAGEVEAALTTLGHVKRASRAAPGFLREVQELRLRAHREAGTIPRLVSELQTAGARDFQALSLLAQLLDELGRTDEALRTLRHAVKLRPNDAGLHVRIVRMLRRSGDLPALIAEYESLVRLRTGDPSLARDLAELLRDVGRRAEALQLLARVTGRIRDGDGLRVLCETYARWGEDDRARACLVRWTRLSPRTAAPWLLLGEHLHQQGDEQGALRAWRRILRSGSDRAQAHARLGAVLLDHRMVVEAAEHYEKAVALAPRHVGHLRGFAEALERGHRGHDAVAVWERVLALAGDDLALRREARRRLVEIWAARGELPARLRQYELRFRAAKEPTSVAGLGDGDRAALLDAGRFVVEGHLRLARRGRRVVAEARHLEEAERALERILTYATGDVEALLGLERLRTGRGDPEGALRALERLRVADPKNEKHYLGRMAKYAMALYRDEEALRYAQQLSALNPRDAEAQRRLGDLYRVRQDAKRAAAAYARAVELDPDDFGTHLELAQLHIAGDRERQALLLLQRVVAGSRDDNLVAEAARAALQVAHRSTADDSLEALLLSLALSHVDRPVFRRLVVELYEHRLGVLRRRLALGGSEAEAARTSLAVLRQRAIKPLLEALVDRDPRQLERVVAILDELNHPGAAAPLLAVAEGPGDAGVRRQALLAAARNANLAMVPRLEKLATGSERRLRAPAAWALARMRSTRASGALMRLTMASAPGVRGYALLGLATLSDARGIAPATRALETDVSPWVRGCAALALARLHRGGHAVGDALMAALARRTGVEAITIVLAIGLLAAPASLSPLADTLFSSDEALREVTRLVLAPGGPAAAWPATLPPPEGRPDLRSLSDAFIARRSGPLAGAARVLGPQFAAAAERALSGPSEQVRAALEVIALEVSVTEGDPAAAMPDGGRVYEALLGLSSHPLAAIRARAWSVLFRFPATTDVGRYDEALGDASSPVRSAILRGLLATDEAPPEGARARLLALARGDESWVLRRQAVRLLGRTVWRAAGPVLRHALASDPSALVRAAAAAQLVHGREDGAALVQAVRRDPDSHVRLAAARALRSHHVIPPGLLTAPGVTEPIRGVLTGELDRSHN
ncbi:MAG: HEAT repeat domain-containing protein [Myxococcales bacterium]|nr:HEAT repeat domain-containing protein [Myxococcales bacterium]